MEVIRTKAVDRSTPVTNVYVDVENQIWVGNRNGLYQVFSPEQGSSVELAPGEWSLMQTHDGNFDIRTSLDDLLGKMGDQGNAIKNGRDRITTATYHETKDLLWVGTRKSGLFEFKTKPAFQLVKRHHTGNSKIPDNQVNTLFLDNRGRLWVGTYGGTFFNDKGSWSVKEKGFSFSAYAQNDTDVWTMGDNLLWKVNSRGKWDPIDVDEELIEGDVADIAFDQNGLLWIVSDIVARFDPATEEATVFGPAIGFTSQDVYCVAVDQKNGVWIGTNDKGLYLIQKASTLYVAFDEVKEVSCGGNANDGALKVKVSGGTAPYSFKWSNDFAGDNPTNLAPGKYIVTVTDVQGKNNTISVELSDPRLTLEVKQGKQASPEGTADGSATVNVKGGKPGYSYNWDSGEKTATAFKLGDGEHQVTVTDKNGCSEVGTVVIGREIAGLNASITQAQDIKCAGDQSAALEVKVNGGKAPFSYEWSNSNLTGELVSNVASGAYTVTVSDGSGQTTTAAIEVNEPAALNVSIKVNTPATTNNEDGKATATTNGGSGTFQYSWSNGEKAAQAVNLGPGEHSVTVTDDAGCQATGKVTIPEDILPLAVNISQTSQVKCSDGKEGALEASVEGGKGPFQFTWGGGEDGELLSKIGSGEYTVTVTDAAGTTASGDFSVKAPKAISLSATVKSPASTGSADGKAIAKASGGSGDFTYKWSNGETAKEATKLGPFEHTVTVTDANGCTATATISISENILDLSASISQTAEIKCAGEKTAAISASTSGGKGPFSFQWNSAELTGEQPNGLPAGEYSVTVTDAVGNTATEGFRVKEPEAVSVSAKVDAPASTNNADGKATAKASGGSGEFTYKWSNGETGKEAAGLEPGEHTVTATDANGCSATATITVSENILVLSASISQTAEIKCAGEETAAISASTSGGKGPFSFQWNSKELTGEQPNGLPAGEYSVTVTDAVGNTATEGFRVKEPEAVSVSAKVDAPASTDNADGKATAKASGGSGEFTYKWSNGETGKEAAGLEPGEHTVTATDGNGCSATASVTVSENILALSASISQTEAIECAGNKTAALKVAISGGKGPFTYEWNKSGMTGEQPGSLAADGYALTVTDAVGNTATTELKVKEPQAVMIAAKVDAPASTGNADGKAIVTTSGGTGDFVYKWDNGETGKTATKLAPGEHSVTATDENGCSGVAVVEISENILALAVNISVVDRVKCAGEKNGSVKLAVSGGKGPFQYKWGQAGLSGDNPGSLPSGTYAVTVEDVTGQTAVAKVELKEPKPLSLDLPTNRPSTTIESENGRAIARASGGTPFTNSDSNYSYKWDNGTTGPSVNNLSGGAHAVTATDANGCSAEVNFETKVRIIPELDATTFRAGETINLKKIFFQPDSTKMDPSSIPTVDELFEFLQENSNIVIEVGGHTNGIPNHAYCDELSTERSKSVAQYLVDKGIPASQLRYKGYGKRNPIATNSTPEGRAKNQRVEIKVLEVKSDGD
ncbi:MAG: OmpA family protein [Bacteroidota bacterium]